MRHRPDRDIYFLRMARLVSSRSTCLSRQVGCVLVNDRNHVKATGYNGPAAGLPHCEFCVKAASGQDLDKCPATHAEQNALLQCGDVYELKTAYCTTAPCIHCIKLLLNTSCQRIVFIDDYPGADFGLRLWSSMGREWMRVPNP